MIPVSTLKIILCYSASNCYFCIENIPCGYLFESPHQGKTNQYPQNIFWCNSHMVNWVVTAPNFGSGGNSAHDMFGTLLYRAFHYHPSIPLMRFNVKGTLNTKAQLFKPKDVVNLRNVKTLIIKYGKYANKFCWKNVSSFCICKSYSHFFSKNTCELDIVLTRTVNILTTNELVKLRMLWTTEPKSSSSPIGAKITTIVLNYHYNYDLIWIRKW